MPEYPVKPLLPDLLKKPVMLFWTIILPQAILLLLNVWTLWLVSGEAKPIQISLFSSCFAAQAIISAITGGAWCTARQKKTTVPWPWHLVLLLGQIGFLWFFTSQLWQMIPQDVDRWIVDEGMLSFYAFSLVMPGIFYTGMQLACFELPISRVKNFGLSLLLTVFAPAIFYFFLVASRYSRRTFEGNFLGDFALPVFFIGFTVFMFVGLIRLMVLMYNWVSERGDLGQMLFAILIAIVGPLGGLTLNQSLPFPADFQSLDIYILTIINGVVVLLPRIKGFELGTLLLRSSTYLFSLYFFFVFLPFLPLALPAIFALGLGFLILVPVVLFVLHTKKLADDFRECAPKIKPVGAVIVMLLGFSLLPGYFLVQAYSDKASVSQALQYVYTPDYEKDKVFMGDVKATRRVLLNLRRFKSGIQMPYISDLYNRVVFEGMVLPDTKIAELFRIFTGEEIDRVDKGMGWSARGGMDFWGPRGRDRGRPWGRIRAQDQQQVALETVEVHTIERGETRRAQLRLTMRNTGKSNEAEFSENFNLPPGVLISGFRLRVGKEMVDGQIFEKRTAQWVYHMIRDFVRRDPGILSFKAPGLVELNIYPFASEETRVAEIDFEFPANFSPVITVGEKSVALFEDQGAAVREIFAGTDPDGKTVVFIPPEQLQALPKTLRRPYLHFILDRSAKGVENLSTYALQITAIAARYPHAEFCRITAANFSLEDLTPGLIDLHQRDTVSAALKRVSLKRQGGLDLGRVLKTELLQYARRLRQNASDSDWQTYPVFVVLSPENTQISDMKDLEFYRELIPEAENHWVVTMNNNFEQTIPSQKANAAATDEVIIFRNKGQVVVISASASKGQMACFLGDFTKPDSLGFTVYDSAKRQFEPIADITSLIPGSEFVAKMSLLHHNQEILLNPAVAQNLLGTLVAESRRLSVLIPSTSFIVVEKSSQWKALQVNESRRLKTANAFEFEEEFKTPGPIDSCSINGLNVVGFGEEVADVIRDRRNFLSLLKMNKIH